MVCVGIGLIDLFVVNNLAWKISIFGHVLSMDYWIYIHLFVIHNLPFNSLWIAVWIFFWEVLSSLFCYMWSVIVLRVILTVSGSSLGDWNLTREQLQSSVVLCGHMRIWLSSMKRTHVPAGGNGRGQGGLAVVMKAVSQWFLNSSLCKT